MDTNKLHWSQGWYYNIEIKKGEYTDGKRRSNLALTRKLLRNVNIEGKDCLDIGTADAVVPILLKRAGAKSVVAYDRFDQSSKISFLRDIYNVDFDYIGGISLPDLQKNIKNRPGGGFFDLVVFSGVLYHLINPLGLLALVRAFCKIGGLFVIETRSLHHSEEKLVFNTYGQYGKNYFSATTAWLDYALRIIGLEPLHAIYRGKLSDSKTFRVAILCRSHADSISLNQNDKFATKSYKHLFDKTSNEAIQYDLDDLLGTQSDIGFAPYDNKVLSINKRSLYDLLNNQPTYRPTEDEMRLNLDATM